ncbi:MAG: DEAD/DEAH box helicase, partial [Deltaproteobacteria bacterium]|nr:DEAD/DEAH box helicase [Deltaproteobacteria bacterium]
MSRDIEDPEPDHSPDDSSASHRPERPNFLTETTFDQFGLPAEVLEGITEAGFTHCTPIQAQVLPVGLMGRDLAGQAQTGTGKTAAFLVPILTRLLGQSERRNGLPQALIIAPTRELAVQIYDDAKILGKHTELTQALVMGGIDYQRQAEILRQGVDMVIGTPGRIIDYIKQGIFKTKNISHVVIDEADRLLDMGFIKDLRYILRKLPSYEKRQSMLFSATLSYRILELTYDYMNLPEFISITPDEITVDRIEQSLFHVGNDEKLSLLLGLLKREDWTRVLIFVNTKSGVEWLTQMLKENGLPAEGITGDLSQKKRLSLMKKFKGGTIKILVATDVASRGIHVEDISHVFNYDLPQDAENYVHRIGRTARVGKPGRAISLACEKYIFHLAAIEEYLGDKIPVIWPEDDWFEEVRSRPVSSRWSRRRAGDSSNRAKRPPKSKNQKKPAKPDAKKPPKAKARKHKRPGGIFGLAPGSYEPALTKSSAETKEPQQKKPRRRHRKKPKSDAKA